MNLRARFLLAAMLLSLLLVGGFSLAVEHFLQVVERGFVTAQIAGELDRQLADFADRGELGEPNPPGFVAFVARDGAPPPLLRDVAARLHALPSGVHGDIRSGGHLYTVAKQRVDAGDLFVAYDQHRNPIEHLERQLGRLTAWAVAGALGASLVLALWLASVVLRPVTRLAAAVTAITPGRGRVPLLDIDTPSELTGIAGAFDSTLQRFDQFAARERAFTRDASHELRTPLAVISSGLQLVQGDAAINGAQRQRLGRVQSAAAQMQALVEGLLFLSRGEDDPPRGPPFRVGELIDDVVRLHSVAAGTRPPAIAVDVQVDRAMTVPRGLLLCVVNNLLRNALEHSASRHIDIVLRDRELVIADAGRGIDGADQARVFEPAIRGPDSAGEGVGLDLVKRICARLGWHIELASAVGAGSRFTLHLT